MSKDCLLPEWKAFSDSHLQVPLRSKVEVSVDNSISIDSMVNIRGTAMRHEMAPHTVIRATLSRNAQCGQ